MIPEQVLSYAPRVLTQSQREHYFEHGYVGVESLVPADTLAEVQAVTNEFVELSRKETQSGEAFDIGPGHSAETPVLRRIKSPDERHATYWKFATGLMADVAADLVGPNVVFHHSKLNFKWFDAGQRFDWHQDIPAWAHTDYSPVAVGVYLEDCGEAQGPLRAIRGSHLEPLHSIRRSGQLGAEHSRSAPELGLARTRGIADRQRRLSGLAELPDHPRLGGQ